jgi:lipoprotein NlpI
VGKLALLSVSGMLVVWAHPARAEDISDLVKQAQAALTKGESDQALKLAEQAVAKDDKSAQAHFLRGTVYEALRRHKDAIADFDKTIALDPKAANAYDHRGSERLKLGQFTEAIKDFDTFLKFKPAEEPSHWRRGIAYYYAGRYDDGRKQFEGYEKVDTNDVENAVWRYLCMARKDGVARARAAILKIGNDRRVPMMEVYALFSGKARPEDVLAATRAGRPSPEQLKERLFYAHLYLGLYHEAAGDKKKAAEHITKAADHYVIGHYMWDVACVHRDLLRSKPNRWSTLN